jgi:hypothetical protein
MGTVYRKTRRRADGTTYEEKTWWIQYYRNGRPCNESSRSEKKTDAERLLKLKEGDIIRGIAVSPKLQRVRFSELLDDFLTDYRINSKKSLSIVEMRLKKHVSPFFRDRRASENLSYRIQVHSKETGGQSC